MEEWPRRHRVTVEEYYRMARVGLLAPDARVELIDGEIIDMPPIGTRHTAVVDRLNALLGRAVEDRAIVRVQGPVRLDDFSAPQPDLTLLTPCADFYEQRHPGPSDILLVVEVSETTLRYDRQVKSALYARHGIPELWIFDTQRKELHVHRDPSGSGYSQMFMSDRPSLQVMRVPGVTIDATALFAGSP
jgi:Uma2 family endonuclease